MLSIGITLGDITGIGPEVAFKAIAALAHERDTPCRFVVIGDAVIARLHAGAAGLELPESAFSKDSWDDTVDNLRVCQPTAPLPRSRLPCGHPVAARAAMDWLQFGARRCLEGKLDALVTGPVNKAAIVDAGFPGFSGQTEFLSELAGTDRTGMMLLGTDDGGRWLRVMLATTHLPLAAVAAALTRPAIDRAIQLASEACEELGLERGRIGVCGLNPHAGEDGKMGGEETAVIGPAVRAAKARGINVHGPFAADTLFHRVYSGEFEVVVAMYHDQGLVPLKMVAFDRGVNWTVGLPFIRTSPDHGTAYDIAGTNRARPTSFVSAIRLAHQLAQEKTRLALSRAGVL